MGAEDQANVIGLICFVANITSSVTIIMVNKQLMSMNGYGFNFATTLCGLHFLTTFISAKLTTWITSSDEEAKKEKPKVPLFDILLFATVANLSIVGLNLSLMLNTVGFYQISKLAIIPCIVGIDFLWLKKVFSSKIIGSIAVVLMGVGISTVSDVGMNGVGMMVAMMGTCGTALQQVLVGHLQKKHSIDATDLVGRTSPIQAMSLLVLGPFIDNFIVGQYPWSYQFHVPSMVFLGGSCLLAACVNLSQFVCIGRFSAVSFQVLGHLKTVAVLSFGWLLFSSPVSWKNLIGMTLAVAGMVLYGVFSIADPPKVRATVEVASEGKGNASEQA